MDILSGSRQLEKRLERASNYEEWRDIAGEMDRKRGNERWRSIDQSSQYDYVSSRRRMDT